MANHLTEDTAIIEGVQIARLPRLEDDQSSQAPWICHQAPICTVIEKCIQNIAVVRATSAYARDGVIRLALLIYKHASDICQKLVRAQHAYAQDGDKYFLLVICRRKLQKKLLQG